MGFRFMEMMLRASMPSTTKCLPYFLHDDAWTEVERARIVERLGKTHPAEVDPMYNNWVFSRWAWKDEPPRYSVRRSTWESGDWASTNLDEILDAVDLHGCHWTSALLAEVLPDARRITAEEAIALPFAWYAEKPEYQRDYYQRHTAIWLVERPHVTALLHTHGDPANPQARIYEEQLHFRPPWHELRKAG